MGIKEIQQHVADWLNSSGDNSVLGLEQLAEKIGLIHDGEKWKRNVKKRNGDTFILPMPEEEEFIQFWRFYGYKTDLAKNVYWIYRDNGWRDTHNKPIKNWKAKCQIVWFKPDNKEVKEFDPSKIAANIHSNALVKERFNQQFNEPGTTH